MKNTILLILCAAMLATLSPASAAPTMDAVMTRAGATYPSQLDPSLARPQLIDLPPTSRNDEDLPCGGLRVGDIEPAPLETRTALGNADWYEQGDGSRIARLELRSEFATGLRVQLENLAGMELRIYDPEGLSVFGPDRKSVV